MAKNQKQAQPVLNKGKAAQIKSEMAFFSRALGGLKAPAKKKAKSAK